MSYIRRGLVVAVSLVVAAASGSPAARADEQDNTLIPNNKRLNDGVLANVYTIQHQAGCTNDVTKNDQLQLAARWHTIDVLNNRSLDGDIGSDGSTPQARAEAAGYHNPVAQTVAINPALAISGVELMNQWYHDPADFEIMSNCSNCEIGVWSENRLDRTVVVAVYGQPRQAGDAGPVSASSPPGCRQGNSPIDPAPDYDASDELEYGINWLPWILRGVYPPPAMPPS